MLNKLNCKSVKMFFLDIISCTSSNTDTYNVGTFSVVFKFILLSNLNLVTFGRSKIFVHQTQKFYSRFMVLSFLDKIDLVFAGGWSI